MSRSEGGRTKPELARHIVPIVAALAVVVPNAVGAAEDLCQGYSGLPAGDGPNAGMVWIEAGSFAMGDDERPEEQAAHEVTVDGFWIDRHEVTNAQFARFIEATAT